MGKQRFLRIVSLGLLVLTLAGSIAQTTYGAPTDSISVGIYSGFAIPYLNEKIKEYDIVGAGIQHVDVLDQLQNAQRAVILMTLEKVPTRWLIEKAMEHGVTMLMYNLEGDMPIEELIAKEIEAYELSQEYGLTLAFAPRIAVLKRHYEEIVQHTDVIYVQLQEYQAAPNFEAIVQYAVNQIKAANPDVGIAIQLSVHPPDWPDIPVEKVAEQVNFCTPLSDTVSIFYLPGSLWKAMQVAELLR